MLDLKRIRENYDTVLAAVESRGKGDFGLPEVIKLDEKRRALLAEGEAIKAEQNKLNKEIPLLKKDGKNTDEIFAKLKTMSENAKAQMAEAAEVEASQKEALLNVPNTPNESVPIGADDNENVELYRRGEPPKFDFDPKPHWEIGTALGQFDFERAAKISGARFALSCGAGARLERAIMNFMLDLHTEKHGFTEMLPPFMVGRAAMTGTGQLPKFEEDMYRIDSVDMFMVPTAEVPLTNLLGGEILPPEQLPTYYTAYTPCFRKEAGSAGRDTKGLIRLHQFNKVELVKFVRPETSYDELDSLVEAAAEVLDLLELPYRVVKLSTGDLGFSAAETRDIEVWMPSYGRYVEISSCSNFESYQARRANIRYRTADGKIDFVHTLNGSGLAIGRTVAAVMENYQQADGSYTIPKALEKYFN